MFKSRHYILVDRKPVPSNIIEWTLWAMYNDVHVADTTVHGVRVSTVFLGLDHNHWDTDSPILFETMIFDNEDLLKNVWRGHYQTRCSTWDEAKKMHQKALLIAYEWIKRAREVTNASKSEKET